MSGGAMPSGTALTQECDLNFDKNNDNDLFWAFGRVGYNLTITVTVTQQNPSRLTLGGLTVSGYIYDIYQWNPVMGTFDSPAAYIQAGYGTLGTAGAVYQSQVNFSALPVTGASFTFQ
jgi:hypothetical protein